MTSYYQRHRERLLQRAKERWRAETPEIRAARRAGRNAAARRWRARNRRKAREATVAWNLANPEKLAALQRRHYLKNRKRRLLYRKSYQQNHRGECLALSKEKKARRLQACPSWSRSDPRVTALYFIAEWLRQRGDDVQVDHLYPLRPKSQNDPCGLHIYANLRICDSLENNRKRNKQPLRSAVVEQLTHLCVSY